MTRRLVRAASPGAWGVQTEYVDATGARRAVSRETVAALLEALGATGERPAREGPVVVARGEALPAADHLRLEDGSERRAPATSARLPLGYHWLVPRGGPPRRLIVSPRRFPAAPRGWGWAVQLYAVRSARSWGMGDAGDLRAIGRWAEARGASFLLVNPLHAALPGLPQQPSPYYPSSRAFRNPLYLRIPDVPGAGSSASVAGAAARAERMNSARVLDRDAVWRLKLTCLEELWRCFGGDRAFDAFCTEGGLPLSRFATFCAISESHRGRPWPRWPGGLAAATPAAIRRAAERHADRLRFHCWLQWLIDRQLSRASRTISLMHDLAVGCDPAGADAWTWQQAMLLDVRVGAPPDQFATSGQDWGIPPFHPHRLRALDYEPFIATIRGTLRHGAGLRVDHVMGLFRIWCIPAGASASDGAYVRYRSRELLDILALECCRAGAHVVGEDLGTVEPSVRTELRRRGVLSYRLAWFEDRPPRRFPRTALAALTTHDLPTVAGLWSGADVEEREAAGHALDREADAGLRRRLLRIAGVPPGAPAAEAIAGAYASLATAPSTLLAATLDDATAAGRRPNLPGAGARPNWSIPLPRTLEQLRRDPLPRRIAAALGSRRP